MIYLSTLAVTLTVAHLALVAPSDPDWGGFRGNHGSGTAPGATLPANLDLDSMLVWKSELPKGYSSPIVVGDRVFVTGVEGDRLLTLCLDAHTGELLWHRKEAFDGKRPGGNSSAAPTPASDGERIFTLFHHLGLIVYDIYGEELWRNDLGAPFNIPHGLSTSPVVHEGALLIQLDQDSESELICLDAVTGDIRWRTQREGAVHSYATPAVHQPEIGPAEVVVSGSYEIVAYSLESGERLWWVTGSAWQTKAVPLYHCGLWIVSAYMPLSGELGLPPMNASFEAAVAERDQDGDGLISKEEWPDKALGRTWFIWDRDGDDKLGPADYAYLISTQTAKGGVFAIRAGGRGDVTDTGIAWTYDNRRGVSDVVSPVVIDETLFLLKDGGLLTAIDVQTGEVGKSGRIGEPDQYYASPVAADGRLFSASLSGQLTLIDGEADWQVLSTTSVEAGRIWSSPALAHGRIYLRGQESLLCLGE